MDALDQLARPAAELLGRVDRSLDFAGAAENHRIWPVLRRVKAMPGEAARAVTALHAAPLLAAGEAARTVLTTFDEVHGALADRTAWRGAAAEAFGGRRSALAAHLTDGAESLTGRADATAAYAEAVADWIGRARESLARTLGEVLGSAEAVVLVTAAPAHGPMPGGGFSPAALAAAEIGARVLSTVAETYDEAESLPRRWAPDLVETRFRPPDGPEAPLDTTRIVR